MLPRGGLVEIFKKEVHFLQGLSEQVEFTQEHIPGKNNVLGFIYVQATSENANHSENID